jgi:hypothetical protein
VFREALKILQEKGDINMARFYDMTNALNDYWGDKKDTKKWKKSWDRTKFTMAVHKMKTAKPNFNDKLQRIVWGKSSN